ncbi:MAG: hypothetical protein K1X95_07725 [Acidimicrobiia bacterium]|nr:hypothetical protein [Acidimicrobiia bacterium]
MDLEAVYTAYVTGQAQNPSLMLAILPSHVLPPSAESMCAALAISDLDVVSATPREKSPENPLDVEAVVAVPAGRPGATIAARLGIGPSLDDLGDEVVASGVDEATRYACTRMSVWSVAVEVSFGDCEPLAALHTQLAIAAAVAPEALAFLDLDAQRLWPATRALTAARAPVAVPATELFTVQSLEHRKGMHWLHTHGLHRCGTLEVEALDVPAADASAIEMLMWATAMRFAEQGTPAPYSPFALGPGLDLAWLPWQDALDQMAVRGHGRLSERDELHRRPAAVLVAAAIGRSGAPEFAALRVHAGAVRAGVPLYVSFGELERRAAAAAYTLARFRELVTMHTGDVTWSFAAEIGLPDAEGDLAEIVVVDVESIDDVAVAGTLRAAPLAAPVDTEDAPVAGSRTSQPVERIVGWTATDPSGQRITQDDALYAD